MSGRSILFLDLATTTGWAEGEPGERATCGSLRLAPKGATPGQLGSGFANFLVPRLRALPPARVIYESPFVSGIKNTHTVLITWGLAFATETYADRFGVPCRKANLNEIRKQMLGFVPRGEGVKEAVFSHVRALGYEPEDDNAADALLGWLFACSVLDPKLAVKTTPLFHDA